MSASATFTGFDPLTPASRDVNVYRMFPQINRDEDDTRDLERWSNVLQDVIELLLYDIDRWTEVFDIDRAPEDFVDAILADLGNPFRFDLTLTQKRKLGKVLVEIYKLKGTEPGVCNVLHFFLGVQCDVVEYHDQDGIWSLGESELGIDSYLGLDESRSRYSFDVEVDTTLTDDQRRIVREIVDYMKPAHTHHIRTVEP